MRFSKDEKVMATEDITLMDGTFISKGTEGRVISCGEFTLMVDFTDVEDHLEQVHFMADTEQLAEVPTLEGHPEWW